MKRGPDRLLGFVGLLTAVAVLLGGCSLPIDDDPQEISADQLPRGLQVESATETVADPTAAQRVVWYLDGQEDPKLVPIGREVDEDAGVDDVLDLLLVDPDEAGEPTRITAGIKLASPLEINDGTARIDLEGIEDLEGQARTFAIAQIVLTVTQFDSIDQVVFESEGNPTAVPDGEGVDQDLVSCRDYEDLLADNVPSPCT